MINSKIKVLIIAFAAILILGGITVYNRKSVDQGPSGIACTMEAKLCPDGSSVGRIGPKCEFVACPDNNPTANWQTYTDPVKNISFKYPSGIGTTYITAVEWPPSVEIKNETLSCTTEKRTINAHQYCVSSVSEGAAGSTYTQYVYATQENTRTAFVRFTLRTVQCENYDDPKKTDCKNERDAFTIDNIIDQIVGTLKLNVASPEPVETQ